MPGRLATEIFLWRNYQTFVGNMDLLAALSAYIGLPSFLALWAGHRSVTGSRMVRYEEADLFRV